MTRATTGVCVYRMDRHDQLLLSRLQAREIGLACEKVFKASKALEDKRVDVVPIIKELDDVGTSLFTLFEAYNRRVHLELQKGTKGKGRKVSSPAYRGKKGKV